jgi:anti-sigma B factor antagonist
MRLADIQLEAEDSVLVARLKGDIDMSNADQLRLELTEMTPNEALGLVLDLSEVDYLDSAGIHLIHRLRENLQARGQRLRLVIPADSLIHDTLRLAGIDWKAEIGGSVETAREGIRQVQSG